MLDLTLKDGIEAAIKEEVPEVIEVINVKDGITDLENINNEA